MEAIFQISSTGRKTDRESPITFMGKPAEVRRWAIMQLVCDLLNGNPKSAVYLDGKRLKPPRAEVDEVVAEFVEVLKVSNDTASNGGRPKGPTKRPRKPDADLTMRQRLRRRRG